MTIECWVTEPDGSYLAHLDRSQASLFRRFAVSRMRSSDPGVGSLEYHRDNALLAANPTLFADGSSATLVLARLAAPDVLDVGDRLQVVGPHAWVDAAQVVGIVVARDRPPSERETHAVGSVNATLPREVAVTVAALGSSPDPARSEFRMRGWNRAVLVDLHPETERRVAAVCPPSQGVPVFQGSPIVGVAPGRAPAWRTPTGANGTHRRSRRWHRALGTEPSPAVPGPLPKTLAATPVPLADEQVVAAKRMAVNAVRRAISEGRHVRTSIQQPATGVTYGD